MGRTAGVLLAVLVMGGIDADLRPLAAGQGARYRRLVGVKGEDLEVKWAVLGAQRRLAGAPCRKVFEDFTDASGRTLQQNLDALDLTPADYLDQIVFYDGIDLGACRSQHVIAVTMPGSRAVFVCGWSFSSRRATTPSSARARSIVPPSARRPSTVSWWMSRRASAAPGSVIGTQACAPLGNWNRGGAMPTTS